MFHTIIIAGNVGRDPEMRYTPNGVGVTSFSVATSRSYKSQGQTVKETIWFRVSCWGKLAEFTNTYVKKGQKVLVEGRLTADPNTGGPRTWTRQDGTTSASFEVNATNVALLSSRGETEANYNGGTAASGSTGTSYAGGEMAPGNYDLDPDNEDIPF